jgi:citrate synthase
MRSVGTLAHAWEQTEQGGRKRGPILMEDLWTYDSPPHRELPAANR